MTETEVQERRVPLRIVATFMALGLAATFAACGGGDTTPRSFEDEQPSDDEAEGPELPPNVQSVVNLRFKKGHFEVQVDAARDYCLDGREGAIFEKPRKGKAQKVGQFKTDEVGADNVKVKRPGGTYYATLAKGSFAKYGEVSTCGGAKSKTVRV